MKLRRLTKEQFTRQYAARSQITVQYLSTFLHAVRCYCGDKSCEGWAMVPLEFETYNSLPARRRTWWKPSGW